ncbi:MAG: flagellar basal body P-ring protein FlgI [Phycisphaerae bacterium]|nr:flagellar basal body P-ring protein FlgI [Phycisphaerae bacterium]
MVHAPAGLMRRGYLAACLAGLAALAGSGGGCDSTPKRALKVDPPPSVVRDIPSVFRGTVGAEVGFRGIEPVYVAGYGLVVGLNGTGGGPLPESVQVTMERELARGGMGKGNEQPGPLAGRTPKEILRDPNVAVVVVEAVIPPGVVAGERFDVRVRALPGASVTSLEGGRLWSTELRMGPVTAFGGMRTRKLAEARGSVFINPFAEPGLPPEGSQGDASGAREAGPTVVRMSSSSAVPRTEGRVLDGGVVTTALAFELVLDNPSHARARSIVSAINSRFPNGPGDTGQTARGRDNARVVVRVPRRYSKKAEEFIQLLRFTQIDQSFPPEYARRYAQELERQPGLAEELSWCLQAVGKPAVPFLVPLYDSGEYAPRMAALRAGAKLGDPRATPHLLQMARSGPAGLRAQTIDLLAEMDSDPRINLALRELADAPDLSVRVAAYEALVKRVDASIDRRPVENAFYVDTLPSKDELIYVTREGEPRIVLFGEHMSLARELLVSAWSDRLMLTAEGGERRLRYRDYRTNRVTQVPVPERVEDLIALMARRATPDDPKPGLGLSFSEIVGALYEIQRQRGVGAAFATGQDRLNASLLQASKINQVGDRPETAEEGPEQEFVPAPPTVRPAGEEGAEGPGSGGA